MYNWCMANRLKINVSKSKVLLVGSRYKLNQVDYLSKISLGNDLLNFTDK